MAWEQCSYIVQLRCCPFAQLIRSNVHTSFPQKDVLRSFNIVVSPPELSDEGYANTRSVKGSLIWVFSPPDMQIAVMLVTQVTQDILY